MQPSEKPPGRSAEAGRAGHRAETRHHRQAVCEARDARGCSVSPHGTSALDVSHGCAAQTSTEEVCSWGQAAVSGVEGSVNVEKKQLHLISKPILLNEQFDLVASFEVELNIFF